MRHSKGAAWPLFLVLLLTPNALSTTATGDWEIDTTAFVTGVIDGDTFDTDFMGRVRLADIDAPEVGEPGAAEATSSLTSLIIRRWAHLDVDDHHGTDRFGRLVAVVYVRYNATHLLNVNQALLKAGLVVLMDFPNEFDPAAWSLHIRYSTEAATMFGASDQLLIASSAAVGIPIAVVLLLLIWRRRYRHGGRQLVN